MTGAILVSAWVESHFGDALRSAAPGARLAVLRDDALEGEPAEIEVAFFSNDLFPEATRALSRVLHRAPRLRWLHIFAAGVDHPWFQGFLARGVRVTTSSGAAAVPIAHTAMLYVLALSRDLPGWQRDQAARRWHERDIENLEGRLLAVAGLGPIGLELARLGKGLRTGAGGIRRHAT